jgi:hypothetical protein
LPSAAVVAYFASTDFLEVSLLKVNVLGYKLLAVLKLINQRQTDDPSTATVHRKRAGRIAASAVCWPAFTICRRRDAATKRGLFFTAPNVSPTVMGINR